MPTELINKLSIITPCFQEKENIQRFKTEIIEFFDDFPFSKEFIFVNDGSTDGSAEILDVIAHQDPRVQVVHHKRNRGLGASVISGIAQVTGDAVLTLDADLTFHPSDFPKLVAVYAADVGCVMGSPLKGHLGGIHPIRKFMSVAVNKIYEILLGIPVTSTSSLFRLYRSDDLKRLNLTSQSFQINAEILLKLLKIKTKIKEVPVTLTQRKFGYSKINVAREIKNHIIMLTKTLGWRLGFG